MRGENRLRPCPFCGNKSIRVVTGIKVTEKHHMVVCDKCSAIVCFEEATKNLACEKYWNKRIDQEEGSLVARFTIAASNEYVDKSTGEVKEQTAYVNCVAWKKLGENVGKLIKGNRCIVNGRLQTRSYETKEGEKRYVTEVVADFIGDSLSNKDDEPSNFETFGDDEQIPF